jgi:TatD DNase family protein
VWFDSHCHLHLCEENAPVGDVVARAQAAEVSEMLTLGIDLESSRRAVEIACDHLLWAAAGVHPNSATQWDARTAAALEELLGHERVVAVGESGLDFYRDHAHPTDQERAFGAHIDLARRHDLALVIHTRSSASRALDLLTELGAPERLVFHCWSAGERELERALALGAYVSFAGNVTFPRADELRAAAALVPEDRLLIETDAPFLSPAPHRGVANEPARVALVGAAVASARGVDAAHVGAASAANARRLLALDRR